MIKFDYDSKLQATRVSFLIIDRERSLQLDTPFQGCDVAETGGAIAPQTKENLRTLAKLVEIEAENT
ncbi:MAG: hypothetical protein ACXAB9_13875 [Candidatus Thorarchaeota archaeon]|jgi:hypothetical protein